jgi:hypothetical protein
MSCDCSGKDPQGGGNRRARIGNLSVHPARKVASLVTLNKHSFMSETFAQT